MNSTILIVAGGTGGHLYPGIALARCLAARRWTVEFVVRKGDLGRSVLARENMPVHELTGQGLPRQLSWRVLIFPFKLVWGSVEALHLLSTRAPGVVVGMGGYLSFPMLLAARWRGIPTLIHEQNVLPGLTNRLLARWASIVAVSFPPSLSYFPTTRTRVTGLPVRADIGSPLREEARRSLGLAADSPTCLLFGGSLGAHRLNAVAVATWTILCANQRMRLQVIHITGERDHAEMEEAYRHVAVPAVVLPYCHTMAAAYAAADLVICRAGASTIAELIAAHRPAILIPYPYASADHQRYNAELLRDAHAAEILLDGELSASRLSGRIRARLAAPPPAPEVFTRLVNETHIVDAASRLAQEVEVLAGVKNL